jgi:hypothetical protein
VVRFWHLLAAPVPIVIELLRTRSVSPLGNVQPAPPLSCAAKLSAQPAAFAEKPALPPAASSESWATWTG